MAYLWFLQPEIRDVVWPGGNSLKTKKTVSIASKLLLFSIFFFECGLLVDIILMLVIIT